MAMDKKNPAVAKRVSDRKAFVKDKMASKGIDKGEARKRFYVQTRVSEMKAKGKTVTPEVRKDLRKKFESGNVSRKGFKAPKNTGADKLANSEARYKEMRKRASKQITEARYKTANKNSSAAGGNASAAVRKAEKKVPAKTSSKVPRTAPKPTGARDRNRRTS